MQATDTKHVMQLACSRTTQTMPTCAVLRHAVGGVAGTVHNAVACQALQHLGHHGRPQPEPRRHRGHRHTLGTVQRPTGLTHTRSQGRERGGRGRAGQRDTQLSSPAQALQQTLEHVCCQLVATERPQVGGCQLRLRGCRVLDDLARGLCKCVDAAAIQCTAALQKMPLQTRRLSRAKHIDRSIRRRAQTHTDTEKAWTSKECARSPKSRETR